MYCHPSGMLLLIESQMSILTNKKPHRHALEAMSQNETNYVIRDMNNHTFILFPSQGDPWTSDLSLELAYILAIRLNDNSWICSQNTTTLDHHDNVYELDTK
jgi:hypothetical protein